MHLYKRLTWRLNGILNLIGISGAITEFPSNKRQFSIPGLHSVEILNPKGILFESENWLIRSVEAY